MPLFKVPGMMFIGTLPSTERQFLGPLFEAAASRYQRFVEPACGVFAMSQIARIHGWPAEALDTSDISLLSSVVGYAVTGEDLGELGIKISDFDNVDLSDPAEVLWAIETIKADLSAQKAYYWQQIARDFRERRGEYVRRLHAQLAALKGTLGGMRYRPLDLFDHLADSLEDPTAFISLNPPTYKAGYEKFFSTGGRVTWKEPEYGVYSPDDGIDKLRDLVRDAPALVIIYAEGEAMPTDAVFIKGGVRSAPHDNMGARSVNSFLLSNRPDEVREMIGFGAKRSGGSSLKQPPMRALPQDHEVGPDSVVQVVKVGVGESNYLRQIWTHNFMGKAAMINLVITVDGYAVGAVGLDPSFSMLGQDSILISHSIGCSDRRMRWNRLLTRLALSRVVLEKVMSPVTVAGAAICRTAMFTKHPEAKEHRGLMKLASRDEDKQFGFRLVYEAPLNDATERECWDAFYTEEAKRWRKSSTSETD